MAKKASTGREDPKPKGAKKEKGGSTAVTAKRTGGRKSDAQGVTGEAFIKLLQSPLVADLLTVGATAALAALAEHGFSSTGAGTETRARGQRAGKAVKEAGKAAAAAIGRRLSNEVEEIRNASKRAKEGAGA
jgi:hypothetical protein